MNEPKNTGWRYKLGLMMFIIPFPVFFITPILIPLMGFSTAESAAIIGSVLLMAEIVWFASIPLIGKEGSKKLKAKLFSVFKIHSGPISYRRHALGITLLSTGIIMELMTTVILLLAYFYLPEEQLPGEFFGMSVQQEAIFFIILKLTAALSIFAGIFTLGARFIDRVRDLFIYSSDD